MGPKRRIAPADPTCLGSAMAVSTPRMIAPHQVPEPTGREGSSPLALAVARNFDAQALAGDGAAISWSIAARAAATGEPVITVDAGVDERFDRATSVAALRLRSVVAVPLRQKGQGVSRTLSGE